MIAKILKSALVVGALALVAGCNSDEPFVSQASSESFTQSYNPEYVDILFMLNDRSPMHDIQVHLVEQGVAFFKRLDAIPSQYRMAFTNHGSGRLLPAGSPYILEKKTGVGTADERANIFKQQIALPLNLHTSANDQGFLSALSALNEFKPLSNVPLVVVFLSDSDDHSSLPAGETDAVDYYKRAYLSVKGNKAELLRVYSINLENPRNSTNRCTSNSVDIDNPGFQDRYFSLARILGGVGNAATANLCGDFAPLIDLTGLRQQTLPTRFKLKGAPIAESLVVSVFSASGEQITIAYSFDTATNEIVFATTPPEASRISVTYHTK